MSMFSGFHREVDENCDLLGQASATYGTPTKRGTRNDFQWHAERIEIQKL
jgi:hypothetical protein